MCKHEMVKLKLEHVLTIFLFKYLQPQLKYKIRIRIKIEFRFSNCLPFVSLFLHLNFPSPLHSRPFYFPSQLKIRQVHCLLM